MLETGALHAEKLRDLTLTAASGLVAAGRWLWAVADDELHVARFTRDGAGEERIRIFAGELPAEKKERKKRKPDLEALLALDEGRLLAVPSGSKANRTVGALLGVDGKSVRPVDFAGLYESLARRGVAGLNVEGAVALDEELWLFHRGNSEGAVNLVVRLELAAAREALGSAGALKMPAACVRGVEELRIGEIGGVALTFTDAARAGGDELVFTAVAESTKDAYLDGPCAGSAIGVLDLGSRKIMKVWPIEGGPKVEGIHVEKWDTQCVSQPGIGTHNVCPDREVLVVTDDDDPKKFSALYRIRW